MIEIKAKLKELVPEYRMNPVEAGLAPPAKKPARQPENGVKGNGAAAQPEPAGWLEDVSMA